MINNLYAIKDTKIGFMQPFTMQNDAVAVRAFANSAKQHNQIQLIQTQMISNYGK